MDTVVVGVYGTVDADIAVAVDAVVIFVIEI